MSEATAAVAKKVPQITSEIAKLTGYLATLVPNASYCTPTMARNELCKNFENVIKCIV